MTSTGGYHAASVEDRAAKALDLRASIGIRSEGYAHVHVDVVTGTANVYVVLPGGAMMPVGGDGDELTLRKRGDFIAAAINAHLSPLPPKPLPHQDA